MPWSYANPTRLRRVFLEGFSVMDVAEPLASFDAGRDAGEIRSFLEERDYDLVGVRRAGLVRGFARREELVSGRLGDHVHSFEEADLVGEAATLAETIHSLGLNERCFVSILGEVGAIVTLADLEKPPVRMYLFGMITIVEMLFVREIERTWPDDSWTEQISEGRLHKAQALLEERLRRSQEARLLDCLQFSDKGQVLLRDPAARERMGVSSVREGQRALKELEAIRNNLAHTQQIISSEWTRIVRFSQRVDALLAGLARAFEDTAPEG